MQPQLPKRHAQRECETFAHQALRFMSREGVEPEVGALKRSIENLADVEHAGDGASVVPTYEEGAEVVALAAAEIFAKSQ